MLKFLFFSLLAHRGAYSDRLTLTNHKNFVSSVCILDDGEWICTGSNDSTICVYAAGNFEPFTVLKGHTSTGRIESAIYTRDPLKLLN